MEALKTLGQAAHKGNTVLIKSSRGASEERLDPMKMDRVKKYAVHISGAITELLRSSLDDVAMAIRLYG